MGGGQGAVGQGSRPQGTGGQGSWTQGANGQGAGGQGAGGQGSWTQGTGGNVGGTNSVTGGTETVNCGSGIRSVLQNVQNIVEVTCNSGRTKVSKCSAGSFTETSDRMHVRITCAVANGPIAGNTRSQGGNRRGGGGNRVANRNNFNNF